MLKLGEKQTLVISRKTSFGVYLREEAAPEKKTGPKHITGAKQQEVLLPRAQVPEGADTGTKVEVFLYKDSQDRLIATTAEPALTLYHTAVLRVKEVGRIGAFLDWGLPKDLLLPFHEQTVRVREGDEVLAALYVDKSERLCATMKVYHYLHKHSPYQVDDMVKGRIYEISGNFGVFVAVDDKFSALIPKKEAAGHFVVGDIIEARVTDVKEDGKLDLSVRKKAYLQMEDDARTVLQVIREYEGVLPFGEKVSPELIAREFGLSKNAYKRALGRLLSQGLIEIGENRIYLKDR